MVMAGVALAFLKFGQINQGRPLEWKSRRRTWFTDGCFTMQDRETMVHSAASSYGGLIHCRIQNIVELSQFSQVKTDNLHLRDSAGRYGRLQTLRQ